MSDAVDRTIGPLDLPKKIARFRALRGIVGGCVMIAVGLVLGLGLWAVSHRAAGPLVLLGILVGGGAIALVTSSISYRQLARAERNPAPYEQFQTSTATDFRVPLHLQPAVVAPGEAIGNWFGPVNTRGMQGIGLQYLAREIDVQAVNTVLFTQHQVIGLMLGPDDEAHLLGTGPLKQAVNEFVKYAPETGDDKGMQFQVLNANHWADMVRALGARPLGEVLPHYLHFGLPYERISYVQVKNHFVNPGFLFHLRDGSRLGYGSFRRDRLGEISSYLRPLVEVR